MAETFLSSTDLAERWNRPLSVIYGQRYRHEGPPAIRIGRELRFRLSDVERWEEANLETAGDAT
ncbi:MAG: helix-turn-helix transcriptional regulator [bacterium]